jgi:hypothetical protein
MILLEEPIYILNFIDIYRFTPVSGCVAMGLSSLLCPGAYDAVKTALRIIIYIFYSGFVCIYCLACSINTELSSLKTKYPPTGTMIFPPLFAVLDMKLNMAT